MRQNASSGVTTITFRRATARFLSNALERINEEFRRRTKTQASLPGHDAVMLLLFGLLRSGQIKLRTLDGYQDLKGVERAA